MYLWKVDDPYLEKKKCQEHQNLITSYPCHCNVAADMEKKKRVSEIQGGKEQDPNQKKDLSPFTSGWCILKHPNS